MAYVDCSSATAATNAQMVEHPRRSIESVDIARDGQCKCSIGVPGRF